MFDESLFAPYISLKLKDGICLDFMYYSIGTQYGVDYILNKSENATLKLSIVYEKVFDKKYLIKLNNVAQTSTKRFVEISPICLV